MNKLDDFIDNLQEQIFEETRQAFGEKGFQRWRNPCFAGIMDNPDAHGRVTVSCGDTMEIFLKLYEGRQKFWVNIVTAGFFWDGFFDQHIKMD